MRITRSTSCAPRIRSDSGRASRSTAEARAKKETVGTRDAMGCEIWSFKQCLLWNPRVRWPRRFCDFTEVLALPCSRLNHSLDRSRWEESREDQAYSPFRASTCFAVHLCVSCSTACCRTRRSFELEFHVRFAPSSIGSCGGAAVDDSCAITPSSPKAPLDSIDVDLPRFLPPREVNCVLDGRGLETKPSTT